MQLCYLSPSVGNRRHKHVRAKGGRAREGASIEWMDLKIRTGSRRNLRSLAMGRNRRKGEVERARRWFSLVAVPVTADSCLRGRRGGRDRMVAAAAAATAARRREAVTRVRGRRRRATQQRRSDVDVDEDEDEDEAAAEDRRVDGYAERDYGWHGVGRSRATVFEKSAPRTNRVTRDAEPRSCVVESRSAGLRSSAPSSAAKKRE